MDAYVYLRVRPGSVEDVLVGMENVKGVRTAVPVVGDWDVLVAMNGPDLQWIGERVLRDVHRIEGVERSVVAPVVPGDVLGIAGGGLRTPTPLQQAGGSCFAQIRAAPAYVARLVEELAGLEDVAAVAMVAGAFDLIVEIPYPWEQAARVVVDRILPMEGVESVRTLVAITLEPEDPDRDQFSAWS